MIHDSGNDAWWKLQVSRYDFWDDGDVRRASLPPMISVSIPFLIAIALVLLGTNACAAIAIAWLIMVSIIRCFFIDRRGLTADGGE